MTINHRETAADWSIQRGSRLEEYASGGRVSPGLDDEVHECLASVVRGELAAKYDAAAERGRLVALLEHIQPDLATHKARELGREHGQAAAARWRATMLGDPMAADTAVVARRVLDGVETDGEAAVAHFALPRPSETYAASRLAADCGWPEPPTSDRDAHHRWDVAQLTVCDEYTKTYTGAIIESVAQACRDALVPRRAGHTPPAETAGSLRPFTRPAGSQQPTPPGWIAEPANPLGGPGEGDAEIVYDPRRHAVMLVAGARSEGTAAMLADQGWAPPAGDQVSQVLWRDRAVAARIALDRPAARPAPAIEVPGL